MTRDRQLAIAKRYTWGERIRHRWPDRAVEIHAILDVGTLYDWGHIPPETFLAALGESPDVWYPDTVPFPKPDQVRHEWWRVSHDLTGEYAFNVSLSEQGKPFTVPVTCYGDSI